MFAKDLPLVSATKFDVPYTALDDGSSAYGTVVNAASGNWVLGSTLKGRRVMVASISGALTGTPTGLKFGLYKGDDANGTNGAVVSGSTVEYLTPAAGTKRVFEIDLSLVDDVTKYYSLGASLNGGGTTAVSVGTVSMFLEAPTKS